MRPGAGLRPFFESIAIVRLSMTAILEGMPVARAVRAEAAAIAAPLAAQGRPPTLCIIRATEDEAALTYERSLCKLAGKLGMSAQVRALSPTATEEQVVAKVRTSSNDDNIDGILVLAPLPAGVNATAVTGAIAPAKDVDGATAASLSSLFMGVDEGFPPATPQAVMRILDFYEIPVAGKRVAVVGRSLVVGKPVAMLLLERDATVTLCHSKTSDLASVVREADIVVSAVGRAKFLGAECFSAGRNQVVVDVGMNVDADGSLCGDVDFDAASPLVGAITPVPGGVGAVATSVLLWHCAIAAKNRRLKAGADTGATSGWAAVSLDAPGRLVSPGSTGELSAAGSLCGTGSIDA